MTVIVLLAVIAMLSMILLWVIAA